MIRAAVQAVPVAAAAQAAARAVPVAAAAREEVREETVQVTPAAAVQVMTQGEEAIQEPSHILIKEAILRGHGFNQAENGVSDCRTEIMSWAVG